MIGKQTAPEAATERSKMFLRNEEESFNSTGWQEPTSRVGRLTLGSRLLQKSLHQFVVLIGPDSIGEWNQ